MSPNEITLNLINVTNSTQGDFQPLLDMPIRAKRMQNLTAEQCIDAYARPIISLYRDVVLITSSPLFGASDIVLAEQPFTGGFSWVCNAHPVSPETCSASALAGKPWLYDLQYSNVHAEILPIDYCMAEPIDEFCTVRFSLINLGFVIGAGIVKAACIFYVVARIKLQPSIRTTGDAIASFLSHHDPKTENRCTAVSSDFAKKPFWLSEPTPRSLPPPPRRLWWSTISWKLFILCAISWMGFGGIYAGFFAAMGNTSAPDFFARLVSLDHVFVAG
jgi:hypothetical protein